MARIAGVELPNGKRIEIGLTYIKGVGVSSSRNLLLSAGVNPDKRVKDLTEDEINKLANEIGSKHIVEGELGRETAANIKRLMDVGCYRGLRHKRRLPCRGQRTKTNARTLKGTKKTVGVKKQKMALPGQK